MAKLNVLRITKRAKDAVRDIDYADKLSKPEREWMEIFIAANYSNDVEGLTILQPNKAKARAWGKAVSGANNSSCRDMANKHTRLSLPAAGEEGADEEQASLDRTSANFSFYKCGRCLKRGDTCVCPAKRAQPYGKEDYMPTEISVEDALINEIDRAKHEAAFDLLPYGTNPPDLKPGHKVVICLPQHYLKDRTGTVVEYRKVSGEYLIAADRPGLKHRDGSQAPTTQVWVRPEALKRAKLSRV